MEIGTGDSSASGKMSDRKAELERKKERLRQMREEKERRKREKELQDAETAAHSIKSVAAAAATGSSVPGGGSAVASGSHAPTPDVRATIDQVLVDIGIAPVNRVLESLSSMPPTSGPPASAESASGGGDAASSLLTAVGSPRRRRKSLSVVSVQSTNIPPRENVMYAKQTQTVVSGPESATTARGRGGVSSGDGGGVDFYTLTYDEEYEEDSLPGLGSPTSESPSYLSKLPPGILPHGMPEVKDVKPAVTKEELEEAKRRVVVAELSEEEKQAIMMSGDFRKFFDRSARLLEREMCVDHQSIFVDYTDAADDRGPASTSSSSSSLSLNRFFHDDRWTKNRVVTSMDWSPAFPELLAAGYDKNPEPGAHHDPDGVCLVWNARWFRKATPEHVFHCQSAVTSAAFARFHRNLVIGATYSGQIVLWDNRVQRRTPVQRSPLSASAHTHPVYCVKVVGTENAHNLVSASTDGRLCTWSLDMLSAPQEVLELQQAQAKQSKPVAVTSLAFPAGDVNNFVVGSEEGNAYAACRHGARVGVLDAFEGHGAPVTAVSAHEGHDFAHLFLTSSFDWTVKLWSLKDSREPLHSFESNDDYVYDVAWSPTHPAMFATVDGTGRLDLWNLNNDTEVPTASTLAAEGRATAALNRVSWTPSGLHVAAGDDAGKIWVYDIGEDLSVAGHDEWAKFAHTLQRDVYNNNNNSSGERDVFDSKDLTSSCSSGLGSITAGSLLR